MKKLLVLSILFSFGVLAQQDSTEPNLGSAPEVSNYVQKETLTEGKAATLEILYTDADGDKATACTLFDLENIQIQENCACEDGICRVSVIPRKTDGVRFKFNVTANEQTSNDGTAQLSAESSVNVWLHVLGLKGVLFLIGFLIFAISYRNSIQIFNWVDNQTYGSRDYILKKFEIMFIEVDPQKITWALLFMSFGLGSLTFIAFALWGKIYLAIVLGIAMMVLGWKSPRPIVDFFENRRKKKYQLQMVDALNLMANGLRAGLTMPQSIGMVVDELPAPVSQEFNLVLQQAKIGVPLDEALENLKKRIYTEDNEMFVTSVNILRETGGNLAETFDTIVLVIRERVRLQLKIETYIASGKIQAYIIGAMPFLMILLFGLGDPDYFPLLFETLLGIIALLIIVGMVSFGMWVIFKIIDIKV